MQSFEFKLTPGFCLYNGVAVQEQKGAYIRFLSENPENQVLRARLEKAFLNHVSYVLKNQNCENDFKKIPKVEFISGSHEEVRNCISLLYHQDNGESEEKKADVKEKEKNEAAAVLLLDSILSEARRESVTDIHIESGFVRFRKNGKLENYGSIQRERNSELVLRIKLLAGMNVLEKRRSQDGQFVFGEENPLFVRVSVVSVVGTAPEDIEESVVMRLLDTTRLPLSVSNLGFSSRQLEVMEMIFSNSNGLVLICGATGSGKSTTAASVLVERVKKSGGSEKIISLEDPPEYIIPGVTQIKIDREKGISYASALEKVFRQDPDVIMIGEIRDEESAKIALRAAMTGHFVIATLHTDSPETSVLRLKDLGCSEEILSDFLRGVVLQELQHDETGPTLLADVCPSENLEFTHFTNVPELITKTRKKLTNRYLKAGPGIHRNREIGGI